MSTEVYKVVTQYSSKGRLLRFLFNPPPLGLLPSGQGTCRFAERLAKYPPDLVTHLGMVRSTAYYDMGCPLELCDLAAARDLWRVIHQDIIGSDGMEDSCN
jgi:hypothetical protein